MLNIHSDIAPQNISQPQKKGVILAVDDNEAALNKIVSGIRDIGYDPIAARNGREALEILHDSGHEINMVFIDKVMPMMDGIAVVKDSFNIAT